MTKNENGDARKRKESESQTVNSNKSKPRTSTLLIENTPALAAASLMLSLIFGGCCSNVWLCIITFSSDHPDLDEANN